MTFAEAMTRHSPSTFMTLNAAMANPPNRTGNQLEVNEHPITSCERKIFSDIDKVHFVMVKNAPPQNDLTMCSWFDNAHKNILRCLL
jgi:hypothetical protein